MAQIHETHVERPRSRGGLFIVTFLVAALLGAAIVVVVMNVQSSFSWPAGQITFTMRPTTPPAPATATFENSDIAPPATQGATAPPNNSAAPETSPTETAPPAATPAEQGGSPPEQTQPQ